MTLLGDAEIGMLRDALLHGREAMRGCSWSTEPADCALEALDSLAALLQETREAMTAYADYRNWAIGGDEYRHKRLVWIGPGATEPVPDGGMLSARQPEDNLLITLAPDLARVAADLADAHKRAAMRAVDAHNECGIAAPQDHFLADVERICRTAFSSYEALLARIREQG